MKARVLLTARDSGEWVATLTVSGGGEPRMLTSLAHGPMSALINVLERAQLGARVELAPQDELSSGVLACWRERFAVRKLTRA